MGNRWQLLREFPRRLLGLGQPVGLPYGEVTALESCYLLFRLLCWELRDVITCCMYTVMILLLICCLMCVTIPDAYIRCTYSILSFNWSVTEIYIIVVDNVFIKQFLEFGVTNRKYKHWRCEMKIIISIMKSSSGMRL
jgi:hypothetical protein